MPHRALTKAVCVKDPENCCDEIELGFSICCRGAIGSAIDL